MDLALVTTATDRTVVAQEGSVVHNCARNVTYASIQTTSRRNLFDRLVYAFEPHRTDLIP
jgi:hypothetical protein